MDGRGDLIGCRREARAERPPGIGIPGGKAGDAVAGPLDVAKHADRRAIGKDLGEADLRVQQLEAVAMQPELVGYR